MDNESKTSYWLCQKGLTKYLVCSSVVGLLRSGYDIDMCKEITLEEYKLIDEESVKENENR